MITVNFSTSLIAELVEDSNIAINDTNYEIFIFKKQE